MKYILFIVMAITSITTVKAQSTLKVLSYNILEGMVTDTSKGKQLFVEWVKDKNPDVLALQECNGFTQKTLEDLAASYGHNYAVIVKESGYPVGVTSRFPIVDIKKVNENMTHGFITASINGYNFCILHLNPHKHLKRRSEIAQVLETLRLQHREKNWLMMGDFNSLSPLDSHRVAQTNFVQRQREVSLKNPNISNLANGEVDYQVQQSVLQAGFVDAGLTYDRTVQKGTGKSGILSNTRIDYIYLSKDLAKKLQYCKFIYDDFTAKYSDHKPLIMELKK
ncbi:exonuclease III [Chitinophaga sp. SYP-B3965]|uniref:endonuclease/exonuclease/phosphatase family protein n=1 Tax=Chitinophaga sp. SYP-B3965 TaxID=2663120 RepID=UPI0012997BF2|nr:endonuclease/exonuclease/phosphatase family protein [Chitinophaga sp. SYP-B3965]MRG45182.1 exonuclease III [Chitinophaga sp. SYP-B3965]